MAKLTSLFMAAYCLFLQLPLAAQEEGAPVRDQGLWQTVVMIAIFMAFFYLIMFRPEQKRRKAAEELRNSLKKGDRVTAVGIVGTVSKIQDDTVILQMVDGSKIEVLKGAINEVISSNDKDDKDNRDGSKKIEPINHS